MFNYIGIHFLNVYCIQNFVNNNVFIQFNKERREGEKMFCILKDSNDFLKRIRLIKTI
jgi:hypothetical protein